MRIWYQSSVPFGGTPTFQPYKLALERNARQVARLGTAVDVHGVEGVGLNFERYAYAAYLNGVTIIENAIRAEAEGYDAVAIGCYTDPCVREIRGSVAIPVLFIMQASMHTACMFGDKFALIGYSRANLKRMRLLTEEYRLSDRLAGTGLFQADFARSDQWFVDPGPVIDGFTQAARSCIEQGADVLIPTCGILNQVLRNNGVREIANRPVVDGSSLLIKLAEGMAELQQTCGFPPMKRRLSDAALREIQDAYRRV